MRIKIPINKEAIIAALKESWAAKPPNSKIIVLVRVVESRVRGLYANGDILYAIFMDGSYNLLYPDDNMFLIDVE